MHGSDAALIEVEEGIRLLNRRSDTVQDRIARLNTALQAPSTNILGLAAGSTCTGTVQITVEDSGTTPVSGVTVTAVGGVGGQSLAGSTNGSGVATITGLYSGSYTVTATKIGYYGESTTVTVVCDATATATLHLNIAPVACGPCGSTPNPVTVADPVYGNFTMAYDAGSNTWKADVTAAATGLTSSFICPAANAITIRILYVLDCSDVLAISASEVICGGTRYLIDVAGIGSTTVQVVRFNLGADGTSTCSPYNRTYTTAVVAGTGLGVLYPTLVGGNVTFTLTG